jgi:isochorismate hydrolase
VPATSDVVLARLNYSAVERSRLQKDRATDAAQSELAELAVSLAAKEARTDKAVIEDLSTPESGSPAAPGQ